VLYLLRGLGLETGIDLDQVAAAGQFICIAARRANASKAGLALLMKKGV
jgi:hydroxymethylglutaryl-CoA lyase